MSAEFLQNVGGLAGGRSEWTYCIPLGQLWLKRNDILRGLLHRLLDQLRRGYSPQSVSHHESEVSRPTVQLWTLHVDLCLLCGHLCELLLSLSLG